MTRLATARTERITLRLPPTVKTAWLKAAKRERLTLTDWLERIGEAALEEPPHR